MATDLVIRDARQDDARALLDIYAPFVTNTAVSFELTPPTAAEFEDRIASAQSQWAWLVAEREGEVAGYAYASAFRTRAAYRFTTETSAYVHPAHRGRGVAAALYRRLFEVLIAKGYCNAYAGIALPNDPSVAFHRSLGFTPVGVFHRGGWKFGRWHDISWWEKALNDRPRSDG
ncbi:MAG TPA: N-acetyltransferase family protein [Vicinamibacteria bacterium]|nr:N-acetyltransferase family protein [Vicinamibacteria bacterium]